MREQVSLHLCGVEEVDAGVVGGVEEAERARRPALLSHRHCPCRNHTHAQAGRVTQHGPPGRERAQSTGERGKGSLSSNRSRGGIRAAGQEQGVRWAWLLLLLSPVKIHVD